LVLLALNYATHGVLATSMKYLTHCDGPSVRQNTCSWLYHAVESSQLNFNMTRQTHIKKK